MRDIILACANDAHTAGIRQVLSAAGFPVRFCCTGASQVLALLKKMPQAVLICQSLTDWTVQSLAQAVPAQADALLLLCSGQMPVEGKSNVVCLNLPLRKAEFLQTVRQLVSSAAQAPAGQPLVQQTQINQAKRLLMRERGISEPQAHRLLQQRSMQSGKPLHEVAQELLHTGS